MSVVSGWERTTAQTQPGTCICVSPGQLLCIFRDRNQRGAKYTSTQSTQNSTHNILRFVCLTWCCCFLLIIFLLFLLVCAHSLSLSLFLSSHIFFLFISILPSFRLTFFAWAVFRWIGRRMSEQANERTRLSHHRHAIGRWNTVRKWKNVAKFLFSKWDWTDHWLAEPFSDN